MLEVYILHINLRSEIIYLVQCVPLTISVKIVLINCM